MGYEGLARKSSVELPRIMTWVIKNADFPRLSPTTTLVTIGRLSDHNKTRTHPSLYGPEISMVNTSIDPLAPYKVSDDFILVLVNVTATVVDDPEIAAAGMNWIQIVEAHELVKRQPPKGYARQPACSNDVCQEREFASETE